MEITGLKWLGIRTEAYEETVAFFRDVLKLEEKETQALYAGFKLPDGDVVDVFHADEEDHKFFTTGRVAGFGVTDVEAARKELESRGIEFIGGIQGEGDDRWTHFRGPDGNVYEIIARL